MFHNVPSERGTLDVGDYALAGLTHLISGERQCLENLLACCGRERNRFVRELHPLSAFRFKLLVVECDVAGRFVERFLYQADRQVVGDQEVAAGFLEACQSANEFLMPDEDLPPDPEASVSL